MHERRLVVSHFNFDFSFGNNCDVEKDMRLDLTNYAAKNSEHSCYLYFTYFYTFLIRCFLKVKRR